MIKNIMIYVSTFFLSLFFVNNVQAKDVVDGVEYDVIKPLTSNLDMVTDNPVVYSDADFADGLFDSADYTLSSNNYNNIFDNNLSTYAKINSNNILTVTFANPVNISNIFYKLGPSDVINHDVRATFRFYLNDGKSNYLPITDVEDGVKSGYRDSDFKNVVKIEIGANWSKDVLKIYELDFFTDELIYLPVTNIFAFDVTDTTATIKFDLPDLEHLDYVTFNGANIGNSTKYNMDKLAPDTEQTVRINTVYKDGTTINATYKFKTDKSIPPDPVASLSATKKHDQVKLNWSHTSTDVDYVIYRKSGVSMFNLFGDSTKIGTTDSKTYVDATVKPDTNYTYTVTALSKINKLESAGKSIDVTTDKEPSLPQIDAKPPSQNDNDDWVITWTQPTTGKIKVLVGGKEYKTVDASDLKVVIKNSDMVFDIWGNPDVQLVHIADDGTTQPPFKPPGGGGIGDIDLGDTITANNLLKVALGLFALVASIVLLRLSFIAVSKLVKLIKDSYQKGGVKR